MKTVCEICSIEILGDFFHGQLATGEWAFMCEECRREYGTGCGPDRATRLRWDDEGDTLLRLSDPQT